jgi:Putative MetA-pathway of phenol degradation
MTLALGATLAAPATAQPVTRDSAPSGTTANTQPVTHTAAPSTTPATTPPVNSGASQAPAAAAQAPAEDDDLINADRPGLAEGSGVVGHGRVQIETGLQFEARHEDSVRARALLFPTLLRIGIGDRFEVRVEGNTFTTLSITDEAGGSAASTRLSGLAPFSLGGKYRFQESTGADHPGIGVLARIVPAWGTGDFRAGRTAGDLRLAVDWDLAPRVSVNPNAGIGVYEGDEDRTFTVGLFAVTLAYAPAPTVSLFVDAGAQTPELPGRGSVIVIDVGVAVIATRNIQIDISAGSGARGNTPPHPFIAAGISLRARAFGRP